MTRYARAKGSKASNEKLPEDSTPWGELRKQILSKQNSAPDNAEPNDETSSSAESEDEQAGENIDPESDQRVWADISAEEGGAELDQGDDNFADFLTDDGTTSASPNSSILLLNRSHSEVREQKPSISNSNGFIKNDNALDQHRPKDKTLDFKKPGKNGIISRGNDLSYTMLLNGEVTKIVNFEGFNIKEVDAQRLYELRKKLYREKKIPDRDIVRTIQLERRKAEKTLQREMKNVCFNCRKSGHYVSDCPEYKNSVNESSAVETGICYKCGSTEHTSHECRLKHASFRFAKCFICNEQGHISRECPDNPRGIYPKGGACKGCGDVTHFAKDCPDLIKQKERKPFTLGTLNGNDIEALDDNFSSFRSSQPRNENKRKHSGMKSFYRQKRFRKQM